MREGKPEALIVRVEGLDPEQSKLGSSGQFWSLIEARRKQKPLSRSELERSAKAHKPRSRRMYEWIQQYI